MRPRFNCPVPIVHTFLFKENMSDANRDAAADARSLKLFHDAVIFFPWRDTWLRTQHDATSLVGDTRRSITHTREPDSLWHTCSLAGGTMFLNEVNATTCNASSPFLLPPSLYSVMTPRWRRRENSNGEWSVKPTRRGRWTRVVTQTSYVAFHNSPSLSILNKLFCSC